MTRAKDISKILTDADISGNIDVDGVTNLDVVDIDGAVDMASTLQVDGAITSSSGMTITTADNTTQLTLTSTDADANAGPQLQLIRDSASPADGDSIGMIVFKADNDAGTSQAHVQMMAVAEDVTNGSEDSSLDIRTRFDGNTRSRIDLDTTETVFNQESIDLDFRVESDGNANMFFVDAGNNRVAIGNNSPSNTLEIKSTANDDGIRLSNDVGSYYHLVRSHGDGLLFDADAGSGGGTGADIRFQVKGSEKYRIESSGNHRWGHSSGDPSAFSSGEIGFQFTSTGQSVFATTGNTGYVNRSDYTSGTIFFAVYTTKGNTVGTISYNGSSTSYNTSSDYRLKENVSYDFDATSRLKQLKPSQFNFIGKSETVDGFLAHEVSSIVPESITGTKDGTEDIGTIKASDGTIINTNVTKDKFPLEENQTWTKTGTQPVYQQIDQAKLVPLLVKTIQELEARITALETA